MKLTTGYKKPIDSDDSVLLAGGGHKNIQLIINDFGAISILGNAATADRLKNDRTGSNSTKNSWQECKIEGGVIKYYNVANTWRGIQNNLTSTSITDSLSANQGKILNEKFSNYLPLNGGNMTGKLIIGNLTATTAYGTLLDIRTNNNTANSIEWAASLKNNYNDKTNYNLGTGIKFALGGETETNKWGGIGIVGTSAYSDTLKLVFYSGGSEKASLKSDGNFYVSGTVYSNNIALVNTNDSRLSNSRAANGGTSSYSNHLNVVSSNEIRFSSNGSDLYNDTTDKNVLHINWTWADNAAGYISQYNFMNGHKGFTNIKAAKFITDGSNNTKVVLGDGTTTAISGLSVASATMASRAADGNQYTPITFKPTWVTLANGGAQIYYNAGAVDKFGSSQAMFFRIFQGIKNGTSFSTAIDSNGNTYNLYRDYILPDVSGLTSAEYKYIAVMGMTNPGNITITGSYYANSDIRYKTILENKHYNSEDFSKLNVFTYNWKDSKEIQIGTSAQDVEQIIPELINEENEIKSLNYAKLGAIGVIELSKEIIKLKQHIKELEERLNG